MKILLTDSTMRILRKNLLTTDEIKMLTYKVRHRADILPEQSSQVEFRDLIFTYFVFEGRRVYVVPANEAELYKIRNEQDLLQKTCGKRYWFEMNGRWADIPADLVTEL